MGKYFSKKAVSDVTRWADQIQNPRSISENIKRAQEKEKAEEAEKRQRFQKRKSKLAGLSAEQIEAEERRIMGLLEKG